VDTSDARSSFALGRWFGWDRRRRHDVRQSVRSLPWRMASAWPIGGPSRPALWRASARVSPRRTPRARLRLTA